MSEKFQGQQFPAPKSTVQIPKSDLIEGIEWLGEYEPYSEEGVKGDSFPLTWADDDNIYTSAGDPCWGDSINGLDFEKVTGNIPNHNIEKINEMPEYLGWGGEGPKPTGLISIGGTLYLAFQNLNHNQVINEKHYSFIIECLHGYDAHIISSKDYGKTWQPSFAEITTPMFPGRTFGSPAFINFGKDNQGARDSYVYAMSGQTWDNGDSCRLGRVSSDKIMEAREWEFVGGYDSNHHPIWVKDLQESIPVMTHPAYLGYVDMVYISSIKRYLMVSWHFKSKSNPNAGSELIIYDSKEPWGPFTLAHHEDLWEDEEMTPYNPRIPLKWFDTGKLEGWLVFSGTWRNGGSTPYYRFNARKFKLKLKR